jgi:two-component system response regulator FixJ
MNAPATVCVVDDDLSVLKGLSRLCAAWGYAVQPFSTAREFLEYLGSRADDVGCVVLDVHLPGMSGLELQAELASRELLVPIVFVTGAGDEKVRSRALADGAVDFLEKPFDHTDLLRAVQQAMARGRETLSRAGSKGYA